MLLLSPGFAISVLLATAYGAAFHLLRGGGHGMLARYLLAAWGGFALGQAVGWLIGWQVLMLGQVHVVEGTLGSGILLLLIHWLTAQPPEPGRVPR